MTRSQANTANLSVASFWGRIGPSLLPFADAATHKLPLSRLLRLGLFQVTTGMVIVLLNGTLNRVMIIELGMQATLVAAVIAIPLIFAPARALIGFRSDNHRSYLGWRRVPYICIGSMLQFGGLAILPVSLLLLSGDTTGPMWIGQAATLLSLLLIGAGMHSTQTAGLALATDIAPRATRARVVALLYVMLLCGMVLSSFIFAWLLRDFSQIKLIQVVQGTAVASLLLNLVALWRQEVRSQHITRHDRQRPLFADAWRNYIADNRSRRFLIALGLGTAAFSMQDILLEPFGGQILHQSVGSTTLLTGVMTLGGLLGFALAARYLSLGINACRLAAYGTTLGLFAFLAVIYAIPLLSLFLFQTGVFLIGLAMGIFSVGMLSAAMERADEASAGLALGAWGAVQASATGLAIFAGGSLRDVFSQLAEQGAFGSALANPSTGYLLVYVLEIVILFSTLVALGPLTAHVARDRAVRLNTSQREKSVGLPAFPG